MAQLLAYRPTVLLGALLLLHCGGQSTDLFDDDSGTAGGMPGNAGRGGSTGGSGAAGGSRPAGGSSATGTGGSATAGMTSSGGTGGTGALGGSSGSAGRSGAGTGGSEGGSGGTADAGSGGSGAIGGAGAAGAGGVAGGSGGEDGLSGAGAGGAGEDECTALAKDMASTLEEARACNIALSRISCTGEVMDQCGCPVVVDLDNSEATQRYRELMQQYHEQCPPVACPAILCRQPGLTRCSAQGTGVMGTCEQLGVLAR
jgi:hypothetical protein